MNSREDTIKTLLKDLGKYLPSKVVPGVMGLVTIPIVTRFFPPTDYGYYVLVWTTITVLSTVVDWLPMSTVRLYPEYRRKSLLANLYSSVILWALICLILLFILLWLSMFVSKPFIHPNLYHLLVLGSFLFAPLTFSEVIDHFLVARRRAFLYSLFNVWKSITPLSFGMILYFWLDLGIECMIWGSLIGVLLSLPFSMKYALEYRFINFTRVSKEVTKDMARYGIPLVVGNLAAWVLNLSDRYILQLLLGPHEVGVYSASYSLSGKTIGLIISLFTLASTPIAMRIWEDLGVRASQDFVTKTTRLYLIFCIPAVVGLSALAKPLIMILTGKGYIEGYVVIPYVVAGMFLHGLQQRYQLGLQFHKKTNRIMAAVILSGLFNIGLNFLLIPKYGLIAAAYTTFLSYCLFFFLVVVFSRAVFVWDFPYKSLFRVCFASLVMGLLVYPVGQSLTASSVVNVLSAVGIGAPTYLFALFLMREFRPQELAAFVHIRKPDIRDDRPGRSL